MSKKGGSRHALRIGAQKRIGIKHRKGIKWLLAPCPGAHKREESISAGVLLRDILEKARNLHEVQKILNSGNLLVDGRKIKDKRFPIGLMDIVTLPAQKISYRMSLSGPNMVPKELSQKAASKKYLRVTKKHTAKGGKTAITFHDGRAHAGDKHIKVGDTCVLSVPQFKLESHIKLEPGVQCLVIKGKHTGELAKLDKIIERTGSHGAEAHLSGASGEFVTLVKYLFAVDKDYE